MSLYSGVIWLACGYPWWWRWVCYVWQSIETTWSQNSQGRGRSLKTDDKNNITLCSFMYKTLWEGQPSNRSSLRLTMGMFIPAPTSSTERPADRSTQLTCLPTTATSTTSLEMLNFMSTSSLSAGAANLRPDAVLWKCYQWINPVWK